MARWKKLLLILAVIPLAVIQFAPVCVIATGLYMVATLERAKREGVYATPEEGMRLLANRSWHDVERVEIEYAGPNAFDGSNPHVWFVTAKVWAASRGDGKPMSPRGYGAAGSFFLRLEDGWVHVPEGAFPQFVGLLMRLFNYWG